MHLDIVFAASVAALCIGIGWLLHRLDEQRKRILVAAQRAGRRDYVAEFQALRSTSTEAAREARAAAAAVVAEIRKGVR